MMLVLLLAIGLAAPELAEAQRLLDQGRLEAASTLLDASDAPPGLIARLRGAIAMERGELEAAARSFERALEFYEGEPSTSLYLAHLYVELGRPGAATELLPALTQLQVVAAPLVKARVQHALGRDNEAYATLRAAHAAYPDSIAPVLELVALSRELGLRLELRRWLGVAVDRATLTLDQALALVDSVYADRTSLALLEALLARFPESGELRGHLGYAYAAAGQRAAAARLFATATQLGAPYAFEAADQFRVVGAYDEALRFNARVAVEARRLSQRLAILFAAGGMGRVVSLEPALREAQVWSARDRYRVAYASYAVGNFQHALELARTLYDGEWSESAKQIVNAVERLR